MLFQDRAGYRYAYFPLRLTLFFCVWCFFVNNANSLVLNEEIRSAAPDEQLRVFIDHDHQHTIRDLLARPDSVDWSVPVSASLDYGLDAHSTYWLRIPNVSIHSEKDWLMQVRSSYLDELSVYFVQNDQVTSSTDTGDQNPFDQRSLIHRWFVFDLPTSPGTYDIYLRVKTTSVVKVPVTFWENSAFWEKEQGQLLLTGGFFGLLLVMALYNLVLGVLVRDGSYLSYVGYVLGIGLFQLTVDGLAYQYLWPQSVFFHGKTPMIFMLVTSVFRDLFTIMILNLKERAPRLRLLLLGLIAGSVILLPASLFLPQEIISLPVALYIMPNVLVCFFVGVYLLFQGVDTARYFVLGWSLYLIGVFRSILTNVGMMPPSFFSDHGIQLGTAFEVIVFSMALANRINIEKKKRLDAQQQSIINLQRFQSIYLNANEGMFRCSREGVMESANPAMVSMMGFEKETDFLKAFNRDCSVFFEDDRFLEFIRSVQLRGQIKHHELRGLRCDGQVGWFLMSATCTRQEDQAIIEGFAFDITQRKKNEEQLLYLSRHDPLTGLVNRREFEQHLERILEETLISKETHSLLVMDLDQFKLINDTCGHMAGDELLRQVTLKMRSQTRGGDILSRLGGDEFGVLLIGCSSEDAEVVADKIRLATQDFRFVWEQSVFSLSISIGLVAITGEISSVKDLLSCGDSACFAAKESGRNRVYVWDSKEIDLTAQKHQVQWAARIAESMEKDYFQLYVQPIVPIGKVSADQGMRYEVLLRLMYDGEMVFPGTFLPAAERYNLMPKLDRWVVNAVFGWLAENPEKASTISHISINLSGLTLGDQDFPDFVRRQFDRHGIPKQKICFEITETIAVTNLMNTIGFIDEFRAIGCHFSLDDFGSGFSSYGYLKNLPVDYLKIDGAFVKDMESDEIDFAMVESINRIGQVMGKKTIAEFVENERIMNLLRRIKVDYAQGFGISKPFPIEQIPMPQCAASGQGS